MKKTVRGVNMNNTFQVLEKRLAEYKVYDAWPYVQSLQETLSYLTISYNLLNEVYEHRKSVLQSTENDIFQEAAEKGKATITLNDLNKTNINIGGYQVNDSEFLRKTTIEFFHYARVSIDVLFQIINAGLLGDKSFPVTDRNLVPDVLNKIDKIQDFANVKHYLDQNKLDKHYSYLRAFDNYIKHIKTVLINVKNSFMFGNNDEFYIKEFRYGNVLYEQVDVLVKTKDTYNYVVNTIDNILKEVYKQIPNCLDNTQRIQEIKFKMQIQKNKTGENIDFISFFIEVENDLSELPSEIKVYPLRIKPNGEIYSFDFSFEKIFIKKRNTDNDADSIVGYAELKNGLDTNEFYRIFTVKSCSYSDYVKYLVEFKNKTQKIKLNLYAMEGESILINNSTE